MAGRFWEFQHLTDNLQGQSPFDHIPRAGKLYIGGIAALYKEEQPDPLQQAGITHVLSILDFDLQEDLLKTLLLRKYQHLQIRVEDTAEEDLLRHFPEICRFIDDGVREEDDGGGGGGVFVHCAMGVSRSATAVIAFLMWKKGMGLKQAWDKVKEGRRRVRPNAGFVKQLQVWQRMVKEKGGWDGEIYEKWKRGGWEGGKL
ncbi:dual specificity phosphatase 1-like [Lecanosticta acicola]|uniref:Dual specificity phosphatase 1-like n=1 Tax=Lecanosticta acicola TaxID=111012 RepID=A0AAI8YSY2_9PEZI|nr:dual specificity phosphatase 1-like [Lecanosticta acicola]